MCKSEIFAELLDAVAKETEISKELILSECKKSDVVDARSILVKLLSDKGFYPTQIAEMMNKKYHTIKKILKCYPVRELNCKMLSTYFERINNCILTN